MFRLLAMLAISACLGCAHPPVSSVSDSSPAGDAAEIYRVFLDGWRGDKEDPVNVSSTAKAPTADALEEFSECADEPGWMPVASIDNLSRFIGDLTYVTLVNPDDWDPRDPRDLIAEGHSIESAVATGFDSGLVTLSAIAFDKSNTTAAFTFSFVCGSLCGSGRTVVFKRSASGWAEIRTQCGSWISQIPGGRPNKSFKPTPLRGAA